MIGNVSTRPRYSPLEVADGSTPGHVNFSLLFRGPLQPLLLQQIYPVEHERLGFRKLREHGVYHFMEWSPESSA